MIAVMIFFLWLISVYSVVSSTVRINQSNQNYIVASNLAREQVEIVKNIRDNNFKQIQKWDSISSDAQKGWEIGKYYRIENTQSGWEFLDTRISMIDDFVVWSENIKEMKSYRLCLDKDWYYTYNCINNTPTIFYKYMYVDQVSYIDQQWKKTTIDDALKFTSKVIWYQWWYKQTDISFILTDWQKL